MIRRYFYEITGVSGTFQRRCLRNLYKGVPMGFRGALKYLLEVSEAFYSTSEALFRVFRDVSRVFLEPFKGVQGFQENLKLIAGLQFLQICANVITSTIHRTRRASVVSRLASRSMCIMIAGRFNEGFSGVSWVFFLEVCQAGAF